MRELAIEAGAVGNGQCSQQLLIHNTRSRELEPRTHPSYMLMLVPYRQISWHHPAVGEKYFDMGRDVEAELIPVKEVPVWPLNEEGSANVPNLGNIKMKDPDFEKWCTGSFQTCVWIGTSTPSIRLQLKSKRQDWKRR